MNAPNALQRQARAFMDRMGHSAIVNASVAEESPVGAISLPVAPPPAEYTVPSCCQQCGESHRPGRKHVCHVVPTLTAKLGPAGLTVIVRCPFCADEHAHYVGSNPPAVVSLRAVCEGGDYRIEVVG